MPVLAAIKATVHPGALTIAATDLDMQLSITMPADTTDHATAVFNPAGMLATVAKVKGKAAILFDGLQSIIETGGATLESGDGFHVEDFPTFNPALYQTRCIIPAADLLTALQAVQCGISTEQARYYLNGIYMHASPKNGQLRLVATDGHRLTMYDLDAAWPAQSQHDSRGGLILPRKSAEVLIRLLKALGDKTIIISTDHTHALMMIFEGDGWRLETKVIDGTFPDYTRVLPRDATTMTFILTASELPGSPSGKQYLAVKLDASEGRMSWVHDGTVAGRDILADGQGAIGFSVRYLADFAKTAPGGLTIEASAAGNAARVLTADPRFLGVLIPMRV
jgi:DNA polymerase-3 subunit beta